jgi:hypothetical protein
MAVAQVRHSQRPLWRVILAPTGMGRPHWQVDARRAFIDLAGCFAVAPS